MSISTESDLTGMQEISRIVGETLCRMREYAQPGMSTLELDHYGGALMAEAGARSAPKLTYGFPGYTCISVNQEVAHGIPSAKKILREGDLVNIDVSAELGGYWSDNGGSFILGRDIRQLSPLVEASRTILKKAISQVTDGIRISEIGRLIESEAAGMGFKVLKNLVGHGIGRSLHEAPFEIPCFYDRFNRDLFRRNAVVAIETFISTGAAFAKETGDGWTLTTKDGSYVAQHEHTLIVTDTIPIILTESNRIWN